MVIEVKPKRYSEGKAGNDVDTIEFFILNIILAE